MFADNTDNIFMEQHNLKYYLRNAIYKNINIVLLTSRQAIDYYMLCFVFTILSVRLTLLNASLLKKRETSELFIAKYKYESSHVTKYQVFKLQAYFDKILGSTIDSSCYNILRYEITGSYRKILLFTTENSCSKILE